MGTLRIDGHTHATRPVEALAKKTEALGFDYAVVCSSGLARGEEICTLADAKEQMDRIVRAQNNPGGLSVSVINRQLKEDLAPFPSLIGFAKADLFQPALSRDVREALDLGFAGIGELIGVHGHGEALERLFAAMDGARVPLFIHGDYPVDAADLERIFTLARRHGSQPVIIGHLGGDFWIQAIEGALGAENVYLDISEVVNQVALRTAANTLPERLLFGSDYPWDSPESMLERINQLANAPSVKEGILGNNMKHILGLC
ncbi:MAG: amidohydrolase family protein [Treponema sp.]|jgi:predicted TIM-barrel fold metal-dependent hydrolase|nr:amidohydrolase family protein [Treponema sp.]